MTWWVFQDVERLAARIPTMQRLHKMPHPEFNHADFLMSGAIGKDLNRHVLKDLNRYIPNRYSWCLFFLISCPS